MSPDFTVVYPGVGEIVADDGSRWAVAGNTGSVTKNGTIVYASWKGKALQWVAPGLYLLSPTDKCYALNRGSGSVAPASWPEKDPPVVITLPDQKPQMILNKTITSKEEWRTSAAYHYYSKVMEKDLSAGALAYTPEQLTALAQKAADFGNAFNAAVFPPLIADPAPLESS